MRLTFMLMVLALVACISICALIGWMLFSSLRQRGVLDSVVLVKDARELARQPGFAEYFERFSECDVAARAPLGCDTAKGYLSQLIARPAPEDTSALNKAIQKVNEAIDAAPPRAVADVLGVDLGIGEQVLTALKQLPQPWKVAILDDRVESGWPHTHGGIVCLPRSFRKLRNLIQTLVHERIHVAQRARPDLFRERIAVGSWHMSPVPTTDLKEVITARIRNNPDLDDFVYALNHIAPISLFDSKNAAARGALSASRVRFVDVHTGLEIDPHVGGNELKEDEEHPFETQAYSIAGAIVA